MGQVEEKKSSGEFRIFWKTEKAQKICQLLVIVR